MFRLGRKKPSNRGNQQDRIPLTLYGPRVVLRPTAAADVTRMHEILKAEEVKRRWGSYDTQDEVYEDFVDIEDATLAFCVEFEGEIIGGLQLWQELEPEYRHAGFDIFLDPKTHGKGFGTEVIRLATRYAFDVLGHHRVTIDPAADNIAAIRAYEKAGFRAVGVMRQYEQGPNLQWHDGLLMECTRSELFTQ